MNTGGTSAIVLAIAAAGLLACGPGGPPRDYSIVQQVPHDPQAYTQGLVYQDGVLYESVGEYGRSGLRRVTLATGAVEASVQLTPDRFGEGLALLNGRLYQLTWKSKVGYVYDAATLGLVDSFAYTGEGWGLATDGKALIMSDGTPTLRFIDPATFAVLRQVEVTSEGAPVKELNELEFVKGELFANIYRSDFIIRIDPASGEVRQWINLAGLLSSDERTPNLDVLNGIAYDEVSGNLWVTGKRWPAMFEISIKREASKR